MNEVNLYALLQSIHLLLGLSMSLSQYLNARMFHAHNLVNAHICYRTIHIILSRLHYWLLLYTQICANCHRCLVIARCKIPTP
ncbi:hypothetical protein HanPSC8_Chr17g0766621 [Helianthus annuus]|nr:hypothetical protein HanPSC8_Chr17g0766621 [Helianthus annuus]